jgi:hypothetical protein
VLIGKAPFLKTHLPVVLSCLGRSLNHYYANAMLVGAIDVMQTMCRMFPNDSPKYLLPCLTQLMKVVLSKECPNSPVWLSLCFICDDKRLFTFFLTVYVTFSVSFLV